MKSKSSQYKYHPHSPILPLRVMLLDAAAMAPTHCKALSMSAPQRTRCYHCGFESADSTFKYYDNKKIDQPRFQCRNCHKFFTLGSHGRPQGKTYAKKRNQDPEELRGLPRQCRHCGVADHAPFKYYNNNSMSQPRFKCLSCGKQFQMHLVVEGHERRLVHTSGKHRHHPNPPEKPGLTPSGNTSNYDNEADSPCDGMPVPQDSCTTTHAGMPWQLASDLSDEDAQFLNLIEATLSDENDAAAAGDVDMVSSTTNANGDVAGLAESEVGMGLAAELLQPQEVLQSDQTWACRSETYHSWPFAAACNDGTNRSAELDVNYSLPDYHPGDIWVPPCSTSYYVHHVVMELPCNDGIPAPEDPGTTTSEAMPCECVESAPDLSDEDAQLLNLIEAILSDDSDAPTVNDVETISSTINANVDAAPMVGSELAMDQLQEVPECDQTWASSSEAYNSWPFVDACSDGISHTVESDMNCSLPNYNVGDIPVPSVQLGEYSWSSAGSTMEYDNPLGKVGSLESTPFSFQQAVLSDEQCYGSDWKEGVEDNMEIAVWSWN